MQTVRTVLSGLGVALSFLMWSIAWSASLTLSTSSFTDTSYPDTEPAYNYNLGYPVYADIVNAEPSTYMPNFDHRYFMSIYGPRYKQVDTSNVGFFDFHQGADIIHDVSWDGVVYDEFNPPNIYSACDGVVDKITDGPEAELEQTGSGRWIRVMCNEQFAANPAWGNIYLAYRHLASIDLAVDNVGDPVAKGQVVGVMGESGLTTTVHLHYSVRRNIGGSSFVNVHPSRVFNPVAIPHLMAPLTNIDVLQMTYSASSARFRLMIPYNQVNIRAITVKTTDNAYVRTYDFEGISEFAGSSRDNNDYVDGLELFAYAFNRGYSAYRRYLQKFDEFPASYPASPQHAPINFRPLLNEGVLQSPTYVLDVVANDLPAGYDINNVSIEVLDIWGNGIRAFGSSSQDLTNSVAFSILDDSEDDAEEHQDGTVDVTGVDLEMVNDGTSKGDQLIGLRFRDVYLPQGVNIDQAYIQFSADEVDSETTSLNIRSEASDDSATFTPSQQISMRTPGSQVVNWSPAPWLTVNEVSMDQRTPDVTSLVQEVTDRSGWSNSSAIGFLISGTGKRVADSGDNVYYRAPYFYAEYNTLASNQPPIADIQYSCTDLSCSFDGTASIDNDGSITLYDWAYGDGNSGSSSIENHTYAAAGSYTVRLTVTDDQGATGFTETLVNVTGPPVNQDDVVAADAETSRGTVAGTFTDTHDQDNSYQSLTEEHSGGKPSRRHDILEHTWQIDLTSGNHILNIDAYVQLTAGDGDTGFDIQWSDSISGPWSTLFAITKTVDDDSYQTASMGTGVSGTVFIRAVDNDRTQQNLNFTTLHVDHVFISGGTPPTNPPGAASAPQPGNGAGDVGVNAQLSWNAGSDAESHDVYFGDSNPPPFAQNQTGTSYDPGLLEAGTTYYWSIDEVNAVGTTPGTLWTFMTSNLTGPTEILVSSIALSTANAGKLGKRGRATVTVEDDFGNPVENATVSGSFTGSYSESVSDNTNASGVVVFETAAAVKGSVSFSFCVADVVKTGLSYSDAGSGCASN